MKCQQDVDVARQNWETRTSCIWPSLGVSVHNIGAVSSGTVLRPNITNMGCAAVLSINPDDNTGTRNTTPDGPEDLQINILSFGSTRQLYFQPPGLHKQIQ